jgi:hypothetical protein
LKSTGDKEWCREIGKEEEEEFAASEFEMAETGAVRMTKQDFGANLPELFFDGDKLRRLVRCVVERTRNECFEE